MTQAERPARGANHIGAVWIRELGCAALAYKQSRILTIRAWDAYAEAHELPKWRALLRHCKTAHWSELLRDAGLLPGSTRGVSLDDLEALVRPVAELWLEEEHTIIGLGNRIQTALSEVGVSYELLVKLVEEETVGNGVVGLDAICQWLHLEQPPSAADRARRFYSEHGRSPTTVELEELGVYAGRQYQELVPWLEELLLPPPPTFQVSEVSLALYGSIFERRVGDVVAQWLLAGDIVWVERQVPLTAGRRFSCDFLIWMEGGGRVLLEADGAHTLRASGSRYDRDNEKTRALRDAMHLYDAEVVIVGEHEYVPAVGRLVSFLEFRKCCLKGNRGDNGGCAVESVRLVEGRHHMPARSAGLVLSTSREVQVAVAFGGVGGGMAAGSAARLLRGETVALAVGCDEVERRRATVNRWRSLELAPVVRIAREHGLARRRTAEAIRAMGLIGVRSPFGEEVFVPNELVEAMRRVKPTVFLRPEDGVPIWRLAEEWRVSRRRLSLVAEAVGVLRDAVDGRWVPRTECDALRSAFDRNRLAELDGLVAHRSGTALARPVDGSRSQAQVAELVGRTPKVVQRLAETLGVPRTFVRGEHGGPPIIVFAPDAVARILAGSERDMRATEGAPPDVERMERKEFDAAQQIEITDVPDSLRSTHHEPSLFTIRRYCALGWLVPRWALAVPRGFRLVFDRAELIDQAADIGLPVPIGYVDEDMAAALLPSGNRSTLLARVSDPECARRLRVHVVRCGAVSDKRFYDPAAVRLSVREGMWRGISKRASP